MLDFDRSHAEVYLIAQEIKRLKPKIPAIVVTETEVVSQGLSERSDAVVAKEATLEFY